MGVLVKVLRRAAGRGAVATLLVLLTGCTAGRLLATVTPGPAVRAGLVYDASHDLRLDVYTPARARSAPVVIFFYGGSWSSGRREGYRFVGKALAQRGWVTVVPDYRLYPRVRYPQFLDDCARAVRWVHEHAAELAGDPERIVLMGHSAGAYNAVMVALAPQRLGATQRPAWLRGVVGIAGPYDFLPLTDPTLQTIFGPPEKWPDTQPVNHVGPDAPQMLLIQGSDDTIVRPRNNEALAARVSASGAPVTQLLLPGLGHAWPLLALAGPLRWRAPVLDHVDAFVRRVTTAPTGQGGL